jgi:hypothetical protein
MSDDRRDYPRCVCGADVGRWWQWPDWRWQCDRGHWIVTAGGPPSAKPELVA